MKLTLLQIISFALCALLSVSCNSSKAPVPAAGGEATVEANTIDGVPAEDLSLVRMWQRGSTAGNQRWQLKAL